MKKKLSVLGIHSWTFSETNNETCISMTGDIQFNLKPSEVTAKNSVHCIPFLFAY